MPEPCKTGDSPPALAKRGRTSLKFRPSARFPSSNAPRCNSASIAVSKKCEAATVSSVCAATFSMKARLHSYICDFPARFEKIASDNAVLNSDSNNSTISLGVLTFGSGCFCVPIEATISCCHTSSCRCMSKAFSKTETKSTSPTSFPLVSIMLSSPSFPHTNISRSSAPPLRSL